MSIALARVGHVAAPRVQTAHAACESVTVAATRRCGAWTRLSTRRLLSSDESIPQPGPLPGTLAAVRLVYDAHGQPLDVLRLEGYRVRAAPPRGNVLVTMLAAPINPADINQVQGVYAKLPSSFPSVGGNEGVGVVAAVGSGVASLSVGDHVIPAVSGWGTWQTHNVCPEEDLIKISADIPVEAAATISVNPCTAYRMLRDFVVLDPGDCVIQNGGNSGVGRAVIQIAAAQGIKTVSVIRDRPNLEEEVASLMALGATKVVTEDEFKETKTRDLLGSLPRPKLALNCVGGSSSLLMSKPLAPGGTMVTYGGMSKRPVMIPTGKLIFDDVVYRGFWMTRWNEQASRAERERMLEDVACMIRTGRLRLPCRTWPFADAAAAFSAALQEKTGVKELLMMQTEGQLK